MNKFITFVAVAALGVSVGLASLAVQKASAVSDAANSKCSITPLGGSNTANGRDSKFTEKGNKVTGRFEVTGKNCNEKVSIASWESPNADGRPLGQQRLYKTTTDTFKEGKHTITVEVPTTAEGKVPGCFYQVDMIKGDRVDMDENSPGAEHYGNERLLGFVLGGTKKCPKVPENKIKVCDLKTKKIVTIKESDFNPTRYSRNLDDCKTKPENVFVCDEATGQIIEVTPAEQGNYLPIDDEACAQVKGVETTEEMPEEVASTGPGSIIAGMTGLGGLAGSAQYYVQSRRRLFKR